MSDEERRSEPERTMFDSSLLARIQEREREEQEAAVAAAQDDNAPPDLGTAGDPIPPPPPPPPDTEMDHEKTPAPSGTFPEAPPPPVSEMRSEEPAEADAAPPAVPPPPPPLESSSHEPQLGEDSEDSAAESVDDEAWEDDSPTGTAPAPEDLEANFTEPKTAPTLQSPPHVSDPSNADGSLRAIHSSQPAEAPPRPASLPTDHATRDLSPHSEPDHGQRAADFTDSATEERDPIEDKEGPALEATGNSLEPTRPGLASHVTTDAHLEEGELSEETSHPTRPQTGAVDKNEDLWAESSVDQLERSDRKSLKAEETAMLPSLDGPETGDIDALDGEPEATAEESGITLVSDDGAVPPVHVKSSPIVLGRGQAADVTILESTLSRKHCQLELKGSRVWVTDLGSGNGTYINDERLVGAAELQPGDRLRLGLKVSFSLPGDEGTEGPVATSDIVPSTLAEGSSSGPTLMPNSAGFSTTNGHGVSVIHSGFGLKNWIPLAVASLVFIIGLTTQVIRHQRASEAKMRLNQADAKLMDGVALYQKGQFKKAEAAVKAAGLQDPSHPMLSRYRTRLSKLVRQEAQLDDAEKLIGQGDLERASALLISLEVEEALKPKAKALMNSMTQARTTDEVKALGALIAEKKFKEARDLLARLKEAGADPAKLGPLEAQIPALAKSSKAPPRRRDALPTGPLNRVHRALRSGQIEEAFRINRDLASSGVKEAARLEGNLAELRELSGLAETAIQRRDHVRALTQTARALKLLKQISPTASGARNKLRTLRAKAFQAEAQGHGRAGRACEARQSLDQAARYNRNIPGLTNGFRVVENHGASELADARDEIQRGASVSSVRHKLEMAICTHSRKSKVSQDARRLLRGQ